MEAITRDQAKEAGFSRYFEGEVCAKGHVAARHVRTKLCVECVRLYNREYASTHKERLKENNREYKTKNRKRIRELNLASYYRNHEENLQRGRDRYAIHKDRIDAANSRWRRANRDKCRALLRAYKARKRNSLEQHSPADVLDIFRMQRGRCGYCRATLGEKYHVDHIIALANGGSNGRSNLQILCVPCNKSKSAKDPVDFARSKGLLI